MAACVCVFEKRLGGRVSGGMVVHSVGRAAAYRWLSGALARRHLVRVLIRTVGHTVTPKRSKIALSIGVVRVTRPGFPGPHSFYSTRA